MVFFIFVCLFLLIGVGLAYVVFNRARPDNGNPVANDYGGPDNSTLSSWNSLDSSNPWHSDSSGSTSSESADLSCSDSGSGSDSDSGSGSCDNGSSSD